jgi:hypothetical protein
LLERVIERAKELDTFTKLKLGDASQAFLAKVLKKQILSWCNIPKIGKATSQSGTAGSANVRTGTSTNTASSRCRRTDYENSSICHHRNDCGMIAKSSRSPFHTRNCMAEPTPSPSRAHGDRQGHLLSHERTMLRLDIVANHLLRTPVMIAPARRTR